MSAGQAIATALLTLLLGGCALTGGGGDGSEWQTGKNAAGKPTAPSGESNVLFATLGQYFAQPLKMAKAKGRTTVLLVQDTVPVTKKKSLSFPQDDTGIRRYLDAVPKACVDAFVRANKARWQIGATPPPPAMIEIVAIGHVNSLFHNGGWAMVHHDHPKALALVSAARPGTCEHHSQALLYFNETRSDGSLASVLVHAKLDGDAWHVEKQAVIAAEDGDEAP